MTGRVGAVLWAVFALGCTTHSLGPELTCTATVHVDSLTLQVDSITFEPKEFEEACRAKWEHEMAQDTT